ncbi:MAG TPA: D-glycero-beta-D-manno-heptose 1-phosphate adenylyltransferase [Bacteroidales bacterium]|nr:D-glycero-beta-D-manno-heptose 1-phosphate adenylyltransferase [Bacteroidales bacterium]
MYYLNLIQSKIFSRDQLSKSVLNWKNENKKIVFTNGCFDLIHKGHIEYLAAAKDFGDKLIIGLNSDNSVKRLKGDLRPINNQEARALLLASLIFTDAIVIFDEDTPEEIIKLYSPDVLVKGGDYQYNEIVGADHVINYGGKVEIIPLVEGYSSTNIIKNISKK